MTSKRPAKDQQKTSKRPAKDQQKTSKRPAKDQQKTSKKVIKRNLKTQSLSSSTSIFALAHAVSVKDFASCFAILDRYYFID
jgi:hypothetical protein